MPWANCWLLAFTTTPDPTILVGEMLTLDAITSANSVRLFLKPLVATLARLCEMVFISGLPPSDFEHSMSAGGESGTLVELAGVRKSFGDNLVLDGIDLSIKRGEVVVIAGPSGSGKSTMLRCINGLEPVDEGEVRFDGRSMTGSGRHQSRLRAQIGMVFQQFNLFAHKTVMENVTLAPIEVKRLSKADAGARAKELLMLGREVTGAEAAA